MPEASGLALADEAGNQYASDMVAGADQVQSAAAKARIQSRCVSAYAAELYFVSADGNMPFDPALQFVFRGRGLETRNSFRPLDR